MIQLLQVLVFAGFIAAAAVTLPAPSAQATSGFVTKAPVKKEHCPKEREDSPMWRNLHPECRKYSA